MPPSGGVIQIRAGQGRGFGLGGTDGGRGGSFGQKRFKMAVVVFLSIPWPLSLHLIMLSYILPLHGASRQMEAI